MRNSECGMRNEEALAVERVALRCRHRALSHSAFRIPRSAFSFTEVLFAVIILGIGFIMIAAIFPVAIQQTKTTTEETSGSTIARGAVNYIQAVVSDADPVLGGTNIPDTAGTVVAIAPDDPLGDDLWTRIQGNVILPQDPRYGWAALYRRDVDATGAPLPYAQVIVIPCEVRSAPTFVTGDTVGATAVAPVNLQPRTVTVDLADNFPLPDTIVFDGDNALAAAEGAYVVISSGANVGRIFRVGNSTGVANTFELIPGSDMEEDDGTTTIPGAAAFIVGRGTPNPTGAPPTFEGLSMAVGVYTTFVIVR